MEAPATLTFKRSRCWCGLLRRLKVTVDGEERLRLWHGQAASISVLPGPHRIQTWMDWCRSNVLEIDPAPGQCITVRCAGRHLLLAALFVFLPPFRTFDVHVMKIERQTSPADE